MAEIIPFDEHKKKLAHIKVLPPVVQLKPAHLVSRTPPEVKKKIDTNNPNRTPTDGARPAGTPTRPSGPTPDLKRPLPPLPRTPEPPNPPEHFIQDGITDEFVHIEYALTRETINRLIQTMLDLLKYDGIKNIHELISRYEGRGATPGICVKCSQISGMEEDLDGFRCIHCGGNSVFSPKTLYRAQLPTP